MGRTPDPRARAIALAYERGRDQAPEVQASGRGAVAERILEIARAEGVPIERDDDLIACLEPLSVGDQIPVEAFSAVARILAFLYELNGERAAAKASPGTPCRAPQDRVNSGHDERSER